MPEHYARIFLLSHMRACTSLAGHILGSHIRINGYFEMHISYENAAALDKQLDVLQRYETLAGFCRSANQPYYYYDAELFRSEPDGLLEKLADWLELDSPLSERYQVFSQTGRARMGDSSALIRRGSIEKTGADYSHAHLPEDCLGRAQAAYRDCRPDIIACAADSLINRSQASRSVL